MLLPFYQVFDDVTYQQAFVEFLKEIVGVTGNGKPPKQKSEIPEQVRLEICLMLLMLAQQSDIRILSEVLIQIKNLINGDNKAVHLRTMVSDSFECVSVLTMLLLLCTSHDDKSFKEIN